MSTSLKNRPGIVRDAILRVLSDHSPPMSVQEIIARVSSRLPSAPPSSIRSYLRLNTPGLFTRSARGRYRLSASSHDPVAADHALTTTDVPYARIGQATLYQMDCFDWLAAQPRNSIHAVVTDPPYGLFEYSPEQQEKLRKGVGGVWRIPPSFDGCVRSPLPRFTTLTVEQLDELRLFFLTLAKRLLPVLVPGAHVLVASNPLVSHILSGAFSEAGLERRGEIIRLTMTLRGGDRPKLAHNDFPEVSVMPRSMWEPWVVYRKPLEGRVADNLHTWGTGGFRRPSVLKPFGDVIPSSPTRKQERRLAPHPSLKPQRFLRQIVRASLPLGKGVVYDPFAGSGSTLAAAEAVGYESIGTEIDEPYFQMACRAIPLLAAYSCENEPDVEPREHTTAATERAGGTPEYGLFQ